jgi:hypothetical protein
MTGKWLCRNCGEIGVDKLSPHERCECGCNVTWMSTETVSIIEELRSQVSALNLDVIDGREVIKNLRADRRKLKKRMALLKSKK